jgi:hypothetical protein
VLRSKTRVKEKKYQTRVPPLAERTDDTDFLMAKKSPTSFEAGLFCPDNAAGAMTA